MTDAQPNEEETELLSMPAPPKRFYHEKIGDREVQLEEAELHVENDIRLWKENPRLKTIAGIAGIKTDAELEAAMQRTAGYDTLKKSMRDLGQLEPIYVMKSQAKYLVLEGATRTTILRDLNRTSTEKTKGKYEKIRVKILPPDFTAKERAILLAKIHVRGTGVRAWGRYVEAQFIHKTVMGEGTTDALMNMTQLADYMGKSLSWVQRLRDAYTFANKYVEFLDNDDAESEAAKNFSILEEASKAKTVGSLLKKYDDPQYDSLRDDFFNMVRDQAFKEYRDARFLGEFYANPTAWNELKSGEKHIASKLALDIKNNLNSPRTKLESTASMIHRAIQADPNVFGDEDVDLLTNALRGMQKAVHVNTSEFRLSLAEATNTLMSGSAKDMKDVQPHELEEFMAAVEYFKGLHEKFGPVISTEAAANS